MTHAELCSLLARLPHFSDRHGLPAESMAFITEMRTVVADRQRLLSLAEEERLRTLLRAVQEKGQV